VKFEQTMGCSLCYASFYFDVLLPHAFHLYLSFANKCGFYVDFYSPNLYGGLWTVEIFH